MSEKTYSLLLTDQQLRVINAGLQELPMKYAAPVVQALNEQLSKDDDE